jgi:hypothetical protein
MMTVDHTASGMAFHSFPQKPELKTPELKTKEIFLCNSLRRVQAKCSEACPVNKQRGGSKNEQSMAEAVAKYLKELVEHK